MEKPKEKEEEQGSPESDTSFEANSLPTDLRFPIHLYRELITKKHQQLLLRYNTCFTCLQHQFTDLNLLQQENLSLRSDNLDLSILISTKENEIMTAISGDLVSEYLRLGVSGNCESPKTVEEVLMQHRGANLKEIAEEEKELKSSLLTRGSVVPKCVSVRSNKYLTVKDSSKGADVTGQTHPLRLRLVSKPVKGKEEADVELELYNQGMAKTELCNKWEETGECPYEERCQFAHGIQDLRPVIRHPRYKTEICRMIISGGTCPYGHRCHFRHSLDPTKEKEVVL